MPSTTAVKVNRRVAQLEPSSTLAITARAKALRAEGKDVVNFAGGEPDFDTPDSIKEAAIQAIRDGHTKYTPSVGAPALKELIAEKFRNDNQLEYKPSQIAVSSGAKHSIYNIIQVLIDDQDEVLIPTPYWVSYPEMVTLAGGISTLVPTTFETRFKLTADLLKKYITPRTKLLLLNSPSNPTGMVYTRNELEAIADVCVKNNIFVLSDEIYEKLIYTPEEYVSIASLGSEIYDLTITVNGVSKAYSMTGWRIGYCAAREDIIYHLKNLQDHSTSNPCSISQFAAMQALREPANKVNQMRDLFLERRNLMASAFDTVEEISYILPDGAFYLFCDFSKLGTSMEIAQQILDEVNVAMIPGEGFGAPGFMRLSFATSHERIEEGTKRIIDWVKKHIS